VFAKADDLTMKMILMVQDYVAYGYPTKKMVNELVRKRGFLRKDNKKEAITNNVLIEELLGEIENVSNGCICIEDVIDNIYNCHKPEAGEVF
jgi:large subunit ribosomal protein L7e